MSRVRILLSLLLALSLGALPACGSEDSGGHGDGGITFADVQGPGLPDTIVDPGDTHDKDQGPRPDLAGDIDESHVFGVFFLVEDDPIIVGVGTEKSIRVQVINYTLDQPAARALIRPELIAHDGGRGEIMSQIVFTGEDGIAQLRFRAGDDAPATYTLRAHVEGASQSAEVDIHVLEAPEGDLLVQLVYQGSLPLHQIQVYLHPAGYYQCGQYNPVSPWPSTWQKTAPSPTSGVRFEDLPAGTRYIAYVTAQGPNGSRAAYGCADAIYIEPDTTQPATVELYTLVLNPAGLYDMEAVFNFTGAIPGEVGRIIDLVVNLFYSPGDFAFDLIDLVIDYYFGQAIGQIVDWVVGLFRNYLVDFMNNWLLNESPDWVQDFFVIGQDLTQIIGRLTLLANLRIAKVMNEQTVNGQENWVGLALYWRLGCPDQGDPDYDPDCGRLDLTLEDIQNTQFPLDLITGHWVGNINNFDRLSIDPHGIQLNYGRLILFVINEILLPWINPNYHSLTDLVLGVVNCQGLANGIVGDLLSNLGVDRDDVRDFCTNSITTIVNPIIMIVYGLGADSNLRLYGYATLVDHDDNLVVDEIVDGAFVGHIEMGTGQQGQQFSATWDAVRQ